MVRDDLEKEDERTIEVESGSTVEDLLDSLEVEPQEVLVVRNGTIVTGRHELDEEDELKVMDVIAGG